MEIENKSKDTFPNYQKIREMSKRMDCTISEADFNTSRPNPYRIDYAASDIHRYLTLKRKGLSL